jgi:hypothetical protein
LVLILLLWTAAMNSHALAMMICGVKRMFKKRYCYCFDAETHKEHKWRVRWWQRPWICRGVSYPDSVLTPNEIRAQKFAERIFPCSEERCEECKGVDDLPHKHYLKFHGYAWTSRPGEPYRDIPQRLKDLTFQCMDPFCRYEIRMTREVFESALLKTRKEINQTWPS